MKERRGTVGRVTGLAESVAAAVRRRQQDREPRVLLYESGGEPRVLSPTSAGHERIVAAATRLIALAAFEPEPPPEADEPSDREAVEGASPLPETDPEQR